MVTKSGIIEFLTKYQDKLNIRLDLENDKLYDGSGAFICNLDDYVETYKLKMGCSFKSLYYNHGFLENVLQCNKCGTVLITREDEDFDPNLKCPTCTDYKPHFSYYTKEEIDNSKELQDMINSYIEMQKFQDDAYSYEKEHGHPYWVVFTKKFYTKKKMYKIELKCDDVRKSIFKGLHLVIDKFLKDPEDEMCYIYKSHIIIPLSFKSIYIHWIYRHLGSCPKDIRSKWYIGRSEG